MAKILAVDDEPAILEMIESILNKDGHLVTKVSNPLKLNMEELHRYDLILLDIMMPGIDGFELCKRIRILVDCPILFLTAKTEENSLVNGLSLGADDYISKPFGVMELRARQPLHTLFNIFVVQWITYSSAFQKFCDFIAIFRIDISNIIADVLSINSLIN